MAKERKFIITHRRIYMRHPRKGNNTRYLNKKKNNISPICRLCKQQNETIQHVVTLCPSISASMYLPFCYHKVAYVIYIQMLTSKCDEQVYV